MADYLLPAGFALFVWWFSTGAVLYAIGRPRDTHKTAMGLMTVTAVIALYLLWAWRDEATVTGAYVAFLAALTVWAWHEMSFLMGFVTGPRTTPCPNRDMAPMGHRAPFIPAMQTLIYHEIAIALTVVSIALLTLGAANHVGLWTFGILWLMRLSSKFNIFLGVRNLTEQFLPDHLKYLTSYFCRRPMNALFPFSVSIATVSATLMGAAAVHAAATPFQIAAWTFLTILMALAVLEHWFLVLPLPAERLWTWGLASRKPRSPNTGETGLISGRPERFEPAE